MEEDPVCPFEDDANVTKDLQDFQTICNTPGRELLTIQCGPGKWLAVKRHRTLLCFYRTGFGKTLTAVATATALLKTGVVKKCIIVTPAGLKDNMIKEFVDGCSETAKQALKCSTVYSMENLKEVEASIHRKQKTLLIVDEAHNFRNLSSKRANALMMIARKCKKILLLTATPMFNSPLDLVSLLSFTQASGDRDNIYDAVSRRSEHDADALPREKFLTQVSETYRLGDLVRHKVAFPTMGDELSLLAKHYPVYSVELVYIPFEEKEAQKIVELTGKDFRFQQRMSIINIDKSIAEDAEDDMDTEESKDTKDGEDGEDGEHGIDQQQVGFHPTSKIARLIENLAAPCKKRILVFIEYIKIVKRVIELLRRRKYDQDARIEEYTSAIGTGARTTLVKNFNSGDIDILVCTRAASEGLDFKQVSEIHLVSLDWNPGTVQQKIGRGVRFKSHEDLPLSQRYVRVYKYISIPGGIDVDNLTLEEIKEKTNATYVDLYMYKLCEDKRKKIEEKLSFMKQYAIIQSCDKKPTYLTRPHAAITDTQQMRKQQFTIMTSILGMSPKQMQAKIKYLRAELFAEEEKLHALMQKKITETISLDKSAFKFFDIAGAGGGASAGWDVVEDWDWGAGAGAGAAGAIGGGGSGAGAPAGAGSGAGARAGAVAGAGSGAGARAGAVAGAGSGAGARAGAVAGAGSGAGAPAGSRVWLNTTKEEKAIDILRKAKLETEKKSAREFIDRDIKQQETRIAVKRFLRDEPWKTTSERIRQMDEKIEKLPGILGRPVTDDELKRLFKQQEHYDYAGQAENVKRDFQMGEVGKAKQLMQNIAAWELNDKQTLVFFEREYAKILKDANAERERREEEEKRREEEKKRLEELEDVVLRLQTEISAQTMIAEEAREERKRIQKNIDEGRREYREFRDYQDPRYHREYEKYQKANEKAYDEASIKERQLWENVSQLEKRLRDVNEELNRLRKPRRG
jgi:superfamily II DNA or RNA helicase